METERTFVVGDIHGCLEMLEGLIEKIEWLPDRDALIFLGDYIDRGKNPKGVVDYILSLAGSSSLVQCLLGNHESMFLDYLSGRDVVLYLMNGGSQTINSYRGEGEELVVPEEHVDFFRSLKTYLELDDHYVVHAGFRPEYDIDEQTLEDMMWIRDPFIYSDYDFGKTVVFGHTPFHRPLVTKNKIGLDTGAVYGNRLTCLELPRVIFHSVEAW
jgi:serine/threonine protein phosphatase 1